MGDMMMNPRLENQEGTRYLFLHVGLAKTATSALQQFFAINGGLLSENGVFYPELTDLESSRNGTYGQGNGYALAYTYLQKKFSTQYDGPECTLDHLVAVLKEAERHILVSSEWLVGTTAEFLTGVRKAAADNGFRCRVICYIRPQETTIEAKYCQRVKIGLVNQSFEEFIFYPNLKNQLERLSKFFGGDLNVRCFQQQQLVDNDIFADFLSAIGLRLDDSYVLPSRRVNASPSPRWVNLFLALNKAGYADVSPLLASMFGSISVSSRDGEDRARWLSPSMTREFRRNTREQCREIARKFLGREGGALFLEEKRESDSDWVDASLFTFSREDLERIESFVERETKGVLTDDQRAKTLLALAEVKTAAS
jgi:hypothetical protein